MGRHEWCRILRVKLGDMAGFGAAVPMVGQPASRQRQRIMREGLVGTVAEVDTAGKQVAVMLRRADSWYGRALKVQLASSFVTDIAFHTAAAATAFPNDDQCLSQGMKKEDVGT